MLFRSIDHDDNSRWSSAFSDDQWLTLDYGKTVSISRVHIDWERAHATRYELQVSADGSAWTTLKTVANSAGGSEDWTGLSGQGRRLNLGAAGRPVPAGGGPRSRARAPPAPACPRGATSTGT